MEKILELLPILIAFCEKHGKNYSPFLFGILLGCIIGALVIWFTTRRNDKSHKELVAAKDETIQNLRLIVHERLKTIKVEKKDKAFFKKVIRFFYLSDEIRNKKSK